MMMPPIAGETTTPGRNGREQGRERAAERARARPGHWSTFAHWR